MAFRFDDLVETGEIDCTRNYSIQGWIKLRGHDGPLRLQLTGRAGSDLRGRKFRFLSRQANPDPEAPVDRLEGILWEQIGPPGDFTASHRVRVVDESAYDRSNPSRALSADPPEIEWKRCLYLEWFSQNGRVVIQLADPVIEFLDGRNDASDGEAATSFEVQPQGAPSDSGSSATGAQPWEDDGEFPFAQREAAVLGDDEPAAESLDADELPDDDSLQEEEDPYGLFPRNLLRDFDELALETDRQIRADEEVELPPPVDELELLDTLLEQGAGEPLLTLLGDDIPLPPHEELTDPQVERALHLLLARLALLGIALDMCEHATPRSAYRYLVEEIIPEELGHREIQHTQWIQHFSTWEGCAECAAEFDREWSRRHPEEQQRETGTPTDLPPESA